MTPEAAIGLAVWIEVVVLLIAIAAAVLQAWRQLRRILRRVGGYGELPILRAFERADADLARILTAVDAVDPLLLRAQRAVATIRRGPQFTGVLGRIVGELGAFVIAARR
jgi:hypothetical protein